MNDSTNAGWNTSDYELLDFGHGRKLERVGGLILDRPSPAAIHVGRSPRIDWSQADLQLDVDGRPTAGSVPAGHWSCRFEQVVFNLKLTPFGHVGLFPEQANNWRWLTAQVVELQTKQARPASALNLFAYTGGTTLTLAASGAQVVHLDASAPAVKWARANADSSGLTQAPVRWIVDDARKFVARELRRGSRYDFIVLDPPSYGHGAHGQRWSIEDDLRPLVRNCLQLLAPRHSALLLSAHCESPSPQLIAEWIQDASRELAIGADRLELTTSFGKVLDAGFALRARGDEAG